MEPTNTPQQAPNPLRPDATTTGTASPHEQGHQNPWADVGESANVTVVDGSPIRMDEVPNVLRPGVARSETNPFKRKPLSSTSGILDSAEGRPREPGMASELPTDTFSQLQVNKSPEPSTNPWQPALDGSTNSGHAQTPQSLLDQDLTDNVWESESKLKSISPGVTPPPAGNVQPLLSASSSLGNSTAVNGPLGNEKAREGETSDDKSKRTTQPQPESLLEAVDDWNWSTMNQ
ncbi:hypothetical protein NUW58_g9788 [Xylaria curta]|uniref:Uncharacterized protein n=1 Tax=Xylaria curta TaxID=42375 RepID=A0ACC1MTI5_9PEZI|nr:hypothetical protein NUW58_g9788 [Xylaria curta]